MGGAFTEYEDNDDPDSMIATIDDLYVHDLIINPQGVIKIGTAPDMWLRNSFNAPIDLSVAISNEEVDGDELGDINDAIYYGDVYSDALFAMRQLSDSWVSLARMVIWPEFIEWTQNEEPLGAYFMEEDDLEIKQICGYDA